MPLSIRSVVIRLPAPGAAAELMQVAAELARLMGADLRALYVEDESLLDVADLPLAREVDPLRPFPQRWRPLAREQLARDFEFAAAALRRRLTEVARSMGVPVEFLVVRGGIEPLAALDQLLGGRDFVFVLPAERQPAPTPVPAGAVLYAPAGVAPRRRGEVIALARDGDAAAARLAERIARGAHAPLAVVDAAGDAEQVHRALGRRRARLIIADADVFASAEDAVRLAALRCVPVIVLPPASGE